MTEADVLHDITKIYKRIEAQNKQTNALYESIKTDKVPHFLESIFVQIPHNRESLLACLDRVIALQEAPLMNVLQKLEMQEEQIISLRMQLLKITCNFHMEKHQLLLEYITKERLLSPFLRALIQAVHKIGLCFNGFFIAWQRDLILGINRELNQKYNKDLQKILEVLKPSMEVSSTSTLSLKNILSQETLNDLPIQKDTLVNENEIGDRSYSVPVLKDSIYQAVAYADFFKKSLRN